MSTFRKARNAFVASLDASLQGLSVKVVGRGPRDGEWRQIVCPLCDDTNGSCDVSIKSGHLHCKQCMRSLELFEWVRELHGLGSTWDACELLARHLGIEIVRASRKGRLPREMTEEFLEQAVARLWTDDVARGCRDMLERRGISNPEILERFGVGFWGGKLIFAQRWPNGTLKRRYRTYNPAAPKHQRWGWSTGSGPTQGLWPIFKPPADDRILLLEGEWDVLTSWAMLLWHQQGLWAYTWTMGVKAIPISQLPEWIKGRAIDICYDNDVFQGPIWSEHVAENERRRAEMKRRQEAMLTTAKALQLAGCHVVIKAIPISPIDLWGGDFSDWVKEGGRDWNDVPGWSLAEIEKAKEVKPIAVSFKDAFEHAGKPVIFPAVVSSLEEDGLTIPTRSEIRCRIGTLPCCSKCRVPEHFPGQIIDWKEHLDELMAALLSRDPERTIQKILLGKPSGCSYCVITPESYVTGSSWVAVEDDLEEVSDRELTIISEQPPTLSGEIRVHGTVHHNQRHVAVRATHLEMRESTEIDMRKVAPELETITCPRSDDVDEIEEAIRARAADLAFNVTQIYGRSSIHVAALLLAHSALWMEVKGHRKRGWLDIAVVGDTSTGKSMTFSHYFGFHGLGRMHTCMENISRAGLTMGGVAGGGQRVRLKPGLMPRAHGKMLALDEFHIMVEEKRDHPMLHLQSARDMGHVGGIKIYGARQLPAAVRLATISNWFGGRRDMRKFPCQHLLDLYGKPEALRRLDFGVIVEGEPDDQQDQVGQRWTKDLEQASILRAWNQRSKDVVITEQAYVQARKQIRDWSRYYAEELPLFTGAEKLFSLLRIAVAAANAVFSHPERSFDAVEVRRGHVEWAARWLEECWETSMYDQLSATQLAKRELRMPIHVEATLTVKLGLMDADAALRLLDNLFGTMSMQELGTYTGMDGYKTTAWAGELVRMGALERMSGNSYHTFWRLTPGAHELLKRLLDLANDFPERFAQRMKDLDRWMVMRGMRGEPGVPPLDVEIDSARREWSGDAGEVIPGPGS